MSIRHVALALSCLSAALLAAPSPEPGQTPAAGPSALAPKAPPAIPPATAVPAPKAVEQTVAMDWDLKKEVSGISDQIRQLQRVVDSARPEEWIKKGAPEAYVRQHKSVQAQMASLTAASNRLAKDPTKLSAALETMFLMADLQQLAGSLSEGVRKYQSPTTADRLAQELANTANNRDRLRSHIADLARMKEEEYSVLQQEAQRCRGMISRQAPDPPVRKTKARSTRQQ